MRLVDSNTELKCVCARVSLPEGPSRGGPEDQQHEPGPGHECAAGEEAGVGQAGHGHGRP